MQWAYPQRWPWLWAVVVVAGFFVWAAGRRRRLSARIAQDAALPLLTPQVRGRMRWLKAALMTLGLLFLTLGLLGPQWGFHWQEVKRRGVDILVVMDVSKSMLAQDIKPNRLERAKLAIHDLIAKLKGDRIGLLAFAGTGFLQCPLTVDYGAFSLILDDVGVETIPRGGTAIAGAIRSAVKALEKSTGSRVIVLITDGEDHEGDTVSAAQEAAKAEIRIFCVGVGTPEGELITLEDEQGNRQFLKDSQGRVVQSRLNEETLKQVALKTGGAYVRATPTAFHLDEIYERYIAVLEPQEFEGGLKKQYEHRFQWFLAAAFLLLSLEPLISDRRRPAQEAR